jgi:Glycosyltransferase family 87
MIRTGSLRRVVSGALVFVVVSTVVLGVLESRLGFTNTLTAMRQMMVLNDGHDWRGKDSWEFMLRAYMQVHQHPGSDLYEVVFFTQHAKFQYPPTSLLFLEPFVALQLHDYWHLNLFNHLVILLASLGMARLSVVMANELGLESLTADRRSRYALMALGFVSTWFFYPVIWTLTLGQIQAWITCATIFACIAYSTGRPGWAGALMGLSALIKPQMALFFIWALLRRDIRFAGAWLGAVVPAALLAIWAYGFEQFTGYRRALAYMGSRGEAYFGNTSINGIMNRLFHNGNDEVFFPDHFAAYQPTVHAVTVAAALVLIAIGLSWNWRSRTEHALPSFLLANLCFTAASPIAWVHHYGALLPLFMMVFLMLLRRAQESGSPVISKSLIGLALTYLVVANDNRILNVADWPVNPIQVCFLIAAGAAAWLLMRETRIEPHTQTRRWFSILRG